MPSTMRGRTGAAAGAGWLGGHRELLEANQGSQLSAKGLPKAQELGSAADEHPLQCAHTCDIVCCWHGWTAQCLLCLCSTDAMQLLHIVPQHSSQKGAPTCAYSLAWPAASAAARMRASADIRLTVAGCSPNCARQGCLVIIC